MPDVLTGLSPEALKELKTLLSSRDYDERNALSHFYALGYKQALIEWNQSVIRKFNEARKLANERKR